jgi:hypothetical protein
MSNEVERYLETQDEAVSLMFLSNKGDELTDILVAALEDALKALVFEDATDTIH